MTPHLGQGPAKLLPSGQVSVREPSACLVHRINRGLLIGGGSRQWPASADDPINWQVDLKADALANHKQKGLADISIAIRSKAPTVCIVEMIEQVIGGYVLFSAITDEASLRPNLVMNCLPMAMLDGRAMDEAAFLAKRTLLMAEKVRQKINII
jgi:hypothetical protein